MMQMIAIGPITRQKKVGYLYIYFITDYRDEKRDARDSSLTEQIPNSLHQTALYNFTYQILLNSFSPTVGTMVVCFAMLATKGSYLSEEFWSSKRECISPPKDSSLYKDFEHLISPKPNSLYRPLTVLSGGSPQTLNRLGN